MIAITGLTMDFARATYTRTKLQAATDAAALSAISLSSATDDQRIAAAVSMFTIASQSTFAKSVTPTITLTPTSATVTATATVPTTITAILGVTRLEVDAASKVKADVTSTPATYGRGCVLALQSSGSGIFLNGDSTIDANCGLFANSVSYNALEVNGPSVVKPAFTCVVGDVKKDSKATIDPAPMTACASMADPFTSLLAPSNANAACTYTKFKVNSGATAVLNPGVYCDGIEIGSNATVTFNSGTYVIRGGEFKIGSTATATGSTVFFYLSGANSRFDWGSGALVTLTGLSSGDRKGMLLWHDYANTQANKFGCHSNSTVQGAIYSPTTDLLINSNGAVGASADWTVWVARRIEMGSHAGLKVRSNYEGSTTPLPTSLTGTGLQIVLVPGSTSVTNARLIE